MAETNLARLRKNAGYSSAKEFAKRETRIAGTTYARYEVDPMVIPMPKAWEIADALDCSIDEVVGRKTSSDSRFGLIQRRYNDLDAEQRSYIEECLDFAEHRMGVRAQLKASQVKAEYLSMAYRFANIVGGSAVAAELYSRFSVADLRLEFEHYLDKTLKSRSEKDADEFERKLRRAYGAALELGFDSIPSQIGLAGEKRRLTSEEDVDACVAEFRARRAESDERLRPRYLQAFDEVFGATEESMAAALEALNPDVPSGYRPSWQEDEL